MANGLGGRILTSSVILLAGLLAETSPTLAWGGLVRQWMDGMNTVCAYSDGEQYMMDGMKICPVSNADAQPSGFPTHGMGMSVGEYQDNNSKVCVYDVMGEKKSLRISSVGLCPLSYQF